MVKHAGTEFCLLTAGAFKQAVINDECVDTIVAGEWFDGISNFPGQQRGKAQPVRLWIVQEPVKGILRKSFPERPGLLLHVHAAS